MAPSSSSAVTPHHELTRTGEVEARRSDEGAAMSTVCGGTIGRQPALTTPTLTGALVMIALVLWLVVIPLELVVYAQRGLPLA
jgi:hypothetical protein